MQVMIQTLWHEVASMHIPCSFEMEAFDDFLLREENVINQPRIIKEGP